MSIRPLPGKWLTALVLVAGASTAAAHEAYEMVAYLDDPSGQLILDGRYDEAIATVENKVRASNAVDELVAATNLCIARTLVGQSNAAVAACDRAVELAGRHEVRRSALRRGGPALAQALNNRGVRRALDGDDRGADSDLRRAAALRSQSRAPERNLAVQANAPRGRVELASRRP